MTGSACHLGGRALRQPANNRLQRCAVNESGRLTFDVSPDTRAVIQKKGPFIMLDYVALVLLIVILALVVYGLIAVWSIPYEIAKSRNHPHQGVAGASGRKFTIVGMAAI